MVSTKKQDKPSAVPEQATLAPGDQAVNSPPSVNDTANTDMPTGDAAITELGAAPDANATKEAGSLDVARELVTASSADSSLDQPSPLVVLSDVVARPSELAGPTSSIAVDLNPAKVEVYPLRSFMDEGELRRRGGPSYQVPRLHAEELEQRKLISRTPLEG